MQYSVAQAAYDVHRRGNLRTHAAAERILEITMTWNPRKSAGDHMPGLPGAVDDRWTKEGFMQFVDARLPARKRD